MSSSRHFHPYRHAVNQRREEALNELFLAQSLPFSPNVDNDADKDKDPRFLLLLIAAWLALRVLKYCLVEVVIMLY